MGAEEVEVEVDVSLAAVLTDRRGVEQNLVGEPLSRRGKLLSEKLNLQQEVLCPGYFYLLRNLKDRKNNVVFCKN